MKAKLKNDCKIKAVTWDNGRVLVAENWNYCYGLAYKKLCIPALLARDPSRGKKYKQMHSIPISKEINRHLRTFVKGNEEINYFQSYCSRHISTEEYYLI